VVVSFAFAFGVATLAQRMGGRTYLVASLAGLAAAVGLAVLLANARRPPGPSTPGDPGGR